MKTAKTHLVWLYNKVLCILQNSTGVSQNKKCSVYLPDQYAGAYDVERQRLIKMYAAQYGVSEDFAGVLFNSGVNWYKEQVKKEIIVLA